MNKFDTMKCKQCGFENKKDAKFCTKCGSSMEPVDVPVKSDNSKYIIIALVAVILLLVGAVGYFALSYFSNTTFLRTLFASITRTVILSPIFYVSFVCSGVYDKEYVRICYGIHS